MQEEHEACHDHDHGADGHKCSEAKPSQHEKDMDYLRTPLDWIESFGRRFAVTSHTHLSAGKEREMLPWLKLTAELDPQRVEIHTVAAYWLRRVRGKEKEAEEFLRQGLTANPDSYEILFELGQLYYENRKDLLRARNLWEAAYLRWEKKEAGKEKTDLFALDQILVRLARLEEEAGNVNKAIYWLELAVAKDASPNLGALKQQIEELKGSAAGPKR
jgi:tetratricopeptide (TPR) repeat protein